MSDRDGNSLGWVLAGLGLGAVVGVRRDQECLSMLSAATRKSAQALAEACVMENLATWFIGITGLAVLRQAGVLLMMCLSMRKSSARMEAIATEVKTKAIPAL